MKKLIFIFILFCSSVLYAQSPFDSFDTTMKNVPMYKSKNAQVFRLYVTQPNSSISYIQVDADKKTLDYYDRKDSMVVSAVIKNNQIKFLSVDPLTKKYPELTPYQFASNTPIQAIDLDGLEAFIVHGTNQTKTGVNFTNEAKEQFKRITGNRVIDDKFRWNAPLTNDMPMRKVAAGELVKYIVETRAKMIANKTITEDEPVSLIGYSHGGNVDIQAADMLNKQYNIKVNLVNVSTPAYNSKFGVDKDNWIYGNAEDPQGNKGINALVHVIHENDRVWQAAGADMYYSDEDGKTKDYTILNSNKGVKLDGPIESHTKLPSNQNLGKVLSTIPAMPAAPKPTLNQTIQQSH